MANQNNDKLITLCGPSGTTINNYNTKWVKVKIIIVIRITCGAQTGQLVSYLCYNNNV